MVSGLTFLFLFYVMNGESAKEVIFLWYIFLLDCCCVWKVYVILSWKFLTVAMESSSPRKEPDCMLGLQRKFSSEGKLVSKFIFLQHSFIYCKWSLCCLYRQHSTQVIFGCWRKNARVGEGLCLLFIPDPKENILNFFTIDL